MAQRSGLFNSVSGDRSYADSDIADYMSLLTQGYGVLEDYKNELEVKKGTGLQVVVDAGGAWLGEPSGWWYINDASVAVALDAEVAGVSRIDRIVIRLDRNTESRIAEIAVLKGSTGALPTAPIITQNETVFELILAQVLIAGGSTEIVLTDERRFLSVVPYCPDCDIAAGYACFINSSGDWTTTQNGMFISDGIKAVPTGEICHLSGLDAGYNYYVQADGSISKDITDCKAGYALTSEELIVGIQGAYGKDEVYTGVMQEFYPMPSVSGEIRLKVQKPADADGVMIRGDVVPYDGSGIAWGYHTVTITDDSNYHGNNKWYSNVGLTNGTKYYYKAFPYKGTTYNETQGVNECEATCRNGLAEWTMDSMSGSNILDTFNSYNLVHNNAVFEQFIIDNGGTFSSAYAYRDKFLPSSWISFHAMIRFGNTNIKYLFGENIDVGYVDYGWGFGIDANGDIFLNTNRVNQILFSTGLQINTTYSLGITFNRSTGQAQVYVNGVLIGTKTVTLPDMSNVLKFYLGATWLVGGDQLVISAYIKMDQVRLYSAQLPAEDFALLYRGGAGC